MEAPRVTVTDPRAPAAGPGAGGVDELGSDREPGRLAALAQRLDLGLRLRRTSRRVRVLLAVLAAVVVLMGTALVLAAVAVVGPAGDDAARPPVPAADAPVRPVQPSDPTSGAAAARAREPALIVVPRPATRLGRRAELRLGIGAGTAPVAITAVIAPPGMAVQLRDPDGRPVTVPHRFAARAPGTEPVLRDYALSVRVAVDGCATARRVVERAGSVSPPAPSPPGSPSPGSSRPAGAAPGAGTLLELELATDGGGGVDSSDWTLPTVVRDEQQVVRRVVGAACAAG